MSSTPATADVPETTPVEKKGLSKYVSRWKSVLRKKDGSKRLSFSSRSAVVEAAPAEASAPATTTPAPVPEAVEVPAESTTDEPTNPTVPAGTIKILISQIDADRARKLSERFKIPIESKDWITAREEKETYRVEKPIRMRIHRTCHQCEATFGGSKTCPSCQHERCSSCPRYPPKKDKKGKSSEKAKLVPGAIEVDNYYNMSEQIVLTIPSRTGGQPLVRKKPMQRVRRTCHACSTMFPPGSKVCSSCSHIRCIDCPREPAKRKFYPDGYPGDAPSATSTAPIKYDCHQCLLTFPPVPHPSSPEGLLEAQSPTPPPPLKCTRCGHERCEKCSRAPPRKISPPPPDPEIVRSIERKIRELGLGGS